MKRNKPGKLCSQKTYFVCPSGKNATFLPGSQKSRIWTVVTGSQIDTEPGNLRASYRHEGIPDVFIKKIMNISFTMPR